MIPYRERLKVFWPEKRNHAARCHPAAAAPVENIAARRCPPPQFELAEHVIPFPADPLRISEIVTRQVVRRFPIRTGRSTTVQEFFAESVEGFPVELSPGHSLNPNRLTGRGRAS